mgnify:CR=1 FL=1
MTRLERGKNDLATVAPIVSTEWHPEKNGALKPCDVTAGSRKERTRLSYDD